MNSSNDFTDPGERDYPVEEQGPVRGAERAPHQGPAGGTRQPVRPARPPGPRPQDARRPAGAQGCAGRPVRVPRAHRRPLRDAGELAVDVAAGPAGGAGRRSRRRRRRRRPAAVPGAQGRSMTGATAAGTRRRKSAPPPGARFRGEVGAVGAGDLAGHGQAEAGAGEGAGRLGAVEAVEDVGEVGGARCRGRGRGRSGPPRPGPGRVRLRRGRPAGRTSRRCRAGWTAAGPGGAGRRGSWCRPPPGRCGG